MDVLTLLNQCEQIYAAPSIKAGPDGKDGASVTALPGGQPLIVFSGTPTDGDFRSLIAWLNDFDFELVHADGFPGRVHRGFLSSLNNLWEQVIDALEGKPPTPPAVKPWWKQAWERFTALPYDTFAEEEPPPLPWQKRPLILGHSLGGALAQMAAVRLQHLKPQVVTFAAPMWTDAEGAHNYPADAQLTLYQSKDDLVPFVPPFAYAQVSEAEIVSQQFGDVDRPLLGQRLAQQYAHALMADLLHEKTRAETWAKVTAAHQLETYRNWLVTPPDRPATRAAA